MHHYEHSYQPKAIKGAPPPSLQKRPIRVRLCGEHPALSQAYAYVYDERLSFDQERSLLEMVKRYCLRFDRSLNINLDYHDFDDNTAYHSSAIAQDDDFSRLLDNASVFDATGGEIATNPYEYGNLASTMGEWRLIFGNLEYNQAKPALVKFLNAQKLMYDGYDIKVESPYF